MLQLHTALPEIRAVGADAMGFARILCSAVLVAATLAGAAAGELDYVEVDRFPPPQGVAAPTETLRAPHHGLWARRTRYHQEMGDAVFVSHAVEAACGVPMPVLRGSASLLAIQAFPKRPATVGAADLRNRFVAAYVRDERGHIRLYQDLTVIELTQLTERFLPRCTAL
jgi:hypothetical protein